MQTHSSNVRLMIAAASMAGALTLAGCTASEPERADAPPAASTAASPTPAASAMGRPASGSVTDAETCAAISDIMTIEFNVETAVREGRMSQQERGGWYGLATRDLARIPTQSPSPVSQKIAEIQATLPHTNPGALTQPVIGTDGWKTAASALSQLCAAAGAQIVLQGFTGG